MKFESQVFDVRSKTVDEIVTLAPQYAEKLKEYNLDRRIETVYRIRVWVYAALAYLIAIEGEELT